MHRSNLRMSALITLALVCYPWLAYAEPNILSVDDPLQPYLWERYDWAAKDAGQFTIFYDKNTVLHDLAERIQQEYLATQEFFGRALGYHLRVVFYDTVEEKQAGSSIARGAGNPIYHARAIIVGRTNSGAIYAHEIAHLYTYELIGSVAATHRLPEWLVEGIAEYVEMQVAGRTHSTHNMLLRDIDDENGDMYNRYVRHYFAFRYLIEAYGKPAVLQMLRQSGATGVEDGFVSAFDRTYTEVKAEIQRYLNEIAPSPWYPWMKYVGPALLFGILFAAVFVFIQVHYAGGMVRGR